MKLGYPCINNTVGCTSNRTLRLRSYNENRLKYKIRENLGCLEKTLVYNQQHGFFFFRIGSGIVPFASHKICKFNWESHFSQELRSIGKFIKKYKFRISMHPDQFVVLNSPRRSVYKSSVKELDYHCSLLDAMSLDSKAKVQIHLGGMYGDKKRSKERFVDRYERLSKKIKKRLVIENDDHIYSLRDCLEVSKKIKIPVVFDTFHHECLNNNEKLASAMKLASGTWNKKDGKMMVDYSSQQTNGRRGSHSKSIDGKHFVEFVRKVKGIDFDLMMEIKDKEKSALKAKKILKEEGFL